MTSIIQKLVHSAEQEIYNTQQRVGSAEERVGSTQHRVNMAKFNNQVRIFAKPEVDALVEAEVEALAEAEAEVKALIKVKTMIGSVTTLHDFATDCLRLSMHFFHPIQQCAQQIYHSALPLSPTSSHLHKVCLRNFVDKQLPHVAAFSQAPKTWGSLLRTIDIRPRQLTSIAACSQRIIAACENIVNIYDAVTFVLEQSLCIPEMVTKIQNSPDGSILFFAHSFSVTMWDVQTGGLIHTFTTQSKINDFTVSTTGDHIACGLSDGCIAFWDIHTKEEGKMIGNGQPVIAVHWLLLQELVVATQNSIHVHNTAMSQTKGGLPTPGSVWGLVNSVDGCNFLVGTSRSGGKPDQEWCALRPIRYTLGCLDWQPWLPIEWNSQMPAPLGRLTHPIRVDSDIVCITPPSGVQLFDSSSIDWTTNPPLLDAATSLAVSLNRNLVAQTKDSIQIFSLDVLKTDKAHNDIRLSHIYPLGKKHIVCVQRNGCLTLLELETLQELYPGDSTSQFKPLPPCMSVSCGPVAELGVLAVVQAWQSGVPLPKLTEAADEGGPLGGLSPNHTWVITVYGSPQQELQVKGMRDRITLAKAPLEYGNMGIGKVYNITFSSETRFYLKAEGRGWNVKIPYNIVKSPSGHYSHTITQEKPVPLSKPRPTPLFTLDTNQEWVIDRESKKICWISPGNLRRGNGGHFWAGTSLVMLGDDGVVRKLIMEEPDR